jgi:hypothetical protein
MLWPWHTFYALGQRYKQTAGDMLNKNINDRSRCSSNFHTQQSPVVVYLLCEKSSTCAVARAARWSSFIIRIDCHAKAQIAFYLLTMAAALR